MVKVQPDKQPGHMVKVQPDKQHISCTLIIQKHVMTS